MPRSEDIAADAAVVSGPVPRDVRAAIGIMRRSLARPPAIGDLAERCGVAERTLSQHFRAHLGLSPGEYMRRLRLAAVREALLSGPPAVSVVEVAQRFGFAHAGRFAEQYRRAFGEAPSATLADARRQAAPPTDGEPDPVPALGSREAPALAVMPCATAAGEPGLADLGDTLVEDVAAALARIRSLTVLLPDLSRARGRDAGRLARELGARYLLTGRLSRAADRIRLVLRLVDAASGAHLWGRSFDGDTGLPFAFRDRVVDGVLAAIPPGIRGAEIDRAGRAAPRALDAGGLALRAMPHLFASRPDAARRAIDMLHHAVEIDPDFGLAAALAAWGHGQLVMYNGTAAPLEERRLARRLVGRAALLDDEDPLALTARCAVHVMDGEFALAEALIARALAIDPACGWSWGRSAWLAAYRGEADTAILRFRRALLLDRHAVARANNLAGIGAAHFSAGRYDKAVFWLRRAVNSEVGVPWANRSLSVAYARIGERRLAADSLATLRRAYPDLTVGRVVAAVPFTPGFLDRLGDGLSSLGLPA